MKKMMKKLVASILAIVMCVSTYMAFDWNVAEASQDTLTSDDFKMVGASVRFEDESTVNGIRFGIGIKESVYSDLDATVKNSIRLLVMPTKLVTGDLEIGETYTNGTTTASAIDTAIGTKWELKSYEDESYYVTYVYLYEIDDTCYDFDVTARAYWKADESSEAVYTDAIERSYIYVAEAALNDVATEESTAYPNAVGSNYSPYTAAQRDALIDVPYEQTENTIWDYVDGAYVKRGEDNSDQFIYDRRIDASKNFKVCFTHKMHAAGTTGQIRLLNFGENSDSSTFFEFDFTKQDDGSYKVHCRRQGSTEAGYIETGHDFAFQGGETYDFILNVTYSGTTMTADLKARLHGADTTAFTSVRSSKFTKTYESLVVGDKFGYCLQGESRGATFEDTYNPYKMIYASPGTTSSVVEKSLEAVRVSGLTTNSTSTKVMMMSVATYDLNEYGNSNANYTLSMDVKFENFNNNCFAGYKLGYRNDLDGFVGADKEVRIFVNKVQLQGVGDLWLADYMTEAQLTAYQNKISNGETVNFKVKLVSTGAAGNDDGITTVYFYVDGVACGSKSTEDQTIYENRLAVVTNTNATFSNLVIE